jgi:hypothetical protein
MLACPCSSKDCSRRATAARTVAAKQQQQVLLQSHSQHPLSQTV